MTTPQQSEGTKNVWVWLPGDTVPVLAGKFTLSAAGHAPALGVFAYDDAYLQNPRRLALDPLNMPVGPRLLREQRIGGLFGVFRDASPEGFALDILERKHPGRTLGPLDRLELSPGDAVGAIEVCDDPSTKRQRFVQSERLVDALTRNPETSARRIVATTLHALTTSLGGERPKLTVMHKGQLWIAKLRARGDHPLGPLQEFVAMRLARKCGIDAAEVEYLEPGKHPMVMVKRFDRHVRSDHSIERKLYASAHTILRLDAPTREDRSRSYVALSHELARICGREGIPPENVQRELFRRMVFNAACGNGDDHPRNHGILHQDGRWGLSPAFDIAPLLGYVDVQAMMVNRAPTGIASRENLLLSCESFGYARDEALSYIEHCLSTIAERWEETVKEAGKDPAELPPFRPAWANAPLEPPAPRTSRVRTSAAG